MSTQQVPQKSPLVSAIIPTHNRADMLCRAVNSVLSQSFTDFEVIVVDDGSTDDTRQRIEAYADPRVRYFKHDESNGAAAARNTGIRQARGSYIAFLDDDDEWLPTKLEKQVPVLQRAPEQVGLVYCWMDYYQDGRLIKEHHPALRGHMFYQVLDRQRLGGCPTLLVRRSVIEEVGGFDESLQRGNDGDFIRRVCLKYEVDFVAEVLVKVHIGHGESITSTSEEGIRNAIRGEQAKRGKFRPQLKARPDIHATILRTIARHWSKLGEMDRANQLLQEAMRLDGKDTSLLQKTYGILPSGIQPVARGSYTVLRSLRKQVVLRLSLMRQRFLDRYKLNDLNQMYPEEWFATRKEGVWFCDVQHFCNVVWELFEPNSVADVGCGPGVYLKCLQESGAESMLGLEGAENALKQAVIPNIVWHDLREPFHHLRQHDLVLCVEVAEHIHKIYSDVLVETIVGLCKPGGHVIFTAAEPSQGGFHHINLQPREFWAKKFVERGFSYSAQLSIKLLEQLDMKHLHWIERNLMVFRKLVVAGK